MLLKLSVVPESSVFHLFRIVIKKNKNLIKEASALVKDRNRFFHATGELILQENFENKFTKYISILEKLAEAQFKYVSKLFKSIKKSNRKTNLEEDLCSLPPFQLDTVDTKK